MAISSLSLIALSGCSDDSTSDTNTDEVGDSDTSTGDGDPSTGDGDGDPATGDGDGDGDPSTGDGDGDPSTGDGDGDPTTGDGDGDPVETCEDGVQNQDESDIDCGGTICGACADGAACGLPEDCTSGQCVDGVCFSGCVDDSACADLDDDCNVGVCNAGMCETAPANDGGACSTGDLCLTNGLCDAGACMEEAVDCSEYDSQCSQGACDPNDGSCFSESINEGMACDDGDACSSAEVCTDGVCIDELGGSLFYEEFANNDAGWTLDQNWAIGAAVAGCGDPGTDHTPTDNNGVSGVVLGGCAPTQPVNAALYYCLTSPVIDTAGQASVWMTYYRDLYSDYTPYMKNKIEVWNGNAWVILFETFGSPGVNDSMWTYFGYDVSAYANDAMQFRWCYNIGSSGAFSRGSWNVDDVTVATSECNGAD